MKLTVGTGARAGGFALPTILLVSTVMIAILVASIGAAATSRVSLDSQYYNMLAKQAAQSGIARATECLQASGYTPQWSTFASSLDLRPNSDCTGATMVGAGVSAYIIGDGAGPSLNVRTRYSIEAPYGTGIGSVLQVVGTTELVRTSSPGTVWRTYQQSLYHRIEAPQTVACPTGFVAVPGDSRFGTSDFCIAKYETKNVGGKAASQAGGTPYVNVSQTEAITASANACAGCRLVSEAQWLTVAHNATNVASNWSGGSVGNGYIYRGHSDSSPSGSLAASTDDADGYFGTGNVSGEQRRTLRLNNGEIVWDLAGNVWEWTTGQTNGGQPGGSGIAWREWNAVGGTGSLSPNPFPSFGTPAASGWTGTNGIGRLYSDSDEVGLRGFRRGLDWTGGAWAGVFTLSLGHPPTSTGNNAGFRMAFVPLSEITCSTGFIPVPGNSLFGTNDFCISKYEAKDVGGSAKSQAAGAPWVNISQASAVTAASGACANCRIIGEAEWMTVAHNAVNVASNWSGGTVGSGSIYRGHSDGTPSGGQVAGTDDTNGYFNTSNASGDQRRTLTLSNGQVIWDFAGNVSEWTSAVVSGAGNQPGLAGGAFREWNAIGSTGTLSPNPFPVYGTPAASAWTTTNGIGAVNSNNSEVGSRGFIRGGNSGDNANAGLFGLGLDNDPANLRAWIGFRMVEVK